MIARALDRFGQAGLRAAALRVVARRAAALVLVCAVVLASAFSGRSYAWCVLTQQVCDRPCDDDECDTPDAERGPALDASCCEDRAIGHLPRASDRQAELVVPPAPVAWLPSNAASAWAPRRSQFAPLALVARAASQRAPPRAGPSSPTARRAVLQVYSC